MTDQRDIQTSGTYRPAEHTDQRDIQTSGTYSTAGHTDQRDIQTCLRGEDGAGGAEAEAVCQDRDGLVFDLWTQRHGQEVVEVQRVCLALGQTGQAATGRLQGLLPQYLTDARVHAWKTQEERGGQGGRGEDGGGEGRGGEERDGGNRSYQRSPSCQGLP